MKPLAAGEFIAQLLSAQNRSRTGKSVEVFGWLIFLEGSVSLLAPTFVSSLLHLATPAAQTLTYFRLASLLVGGLGMLYIISGRLNAEGFMFASLIDRPLVPVVMIVLWVTGNIPGVLALLFSIQDLGSALWTFFTWRTELAPGVETEDNKGNKESYHNPAK